jgi:hypothetical protein
MYKYLLTSIEFGSFSEEVSRDVIVETIKDSRTAQLERIANKDGITTYCSALCIVTVALV